MSANLKVKSETTCPIPIQCPILTLINELGQSAMYYVI